MSSLGAPPESAPGESGFGNWPDRGDNRAVPADGTHSLLERRAHLLGTRSRDDAELAEVTAELAAALSNHPSIRRIVLGAGPHGDEEARSLAAMEPVNPLEGQADLADRFDNDRRVFALVHDSLPDLTANIVWVALRQGLPDRLQDILDPSAPTIDAGTADTAVYYSIWNVQPGLAGLGGGRELIEATASLLSSEFPNLSTHVTLSPVPGLRRWLVAEGFDEGSPPGDLESLCARYLCTSRADGRPIDPVARFHLGNGARLLRVLADADTSQTGQSRSWGMMANYRYVPEDRAANREALAGGSPALGQLVQRLLHD